MGKYRCRGVRSFLTDEFRKEIDKSYTLNYEAVQCDDDAEVFGVYEIQEDGTDLWVADFKSQEAALEYVRLAEKYTCLEFDHRTAMLLLDFAKTEIDELSKRLEKGEIMAQK